MIQWPADVQDPYTLDWKSSAVRWLLKIAPGYDDPRLREQPLLLAHAAWWTVSGILDGTRHAYRAAPEDLDQWAGRTDIGHLRGLYTRNGTELRRLLAEVTAVRAAMLRDAHQKAHREATHQAMKAAKRAPQQWARKAAGRTSAKPE